jgi:hypothetical protein
MNNFVVILSGVKRSETKSKNPVEALLASFHGIPRLRWG